MCLCNACGHKKAIITLETPFMLYIGSLDFIELKSNERNTICLNALWLRNSLLKWQLDKNNHLAHSY